MALILSEMILCVLNPSPAFHLFDRDVLFLNVILCLTHLNVLDISIISNTTDYTKFPMKHAHGFINIYLLVLYGNALAVPPFVGVAIRMCKPNY